MRKVIITGADGFIGRKLVKLFLSNDFEVHAIVLNENFGVVDKNLYTYKCFFEDYDTLKYKLPKNSELFYHLAWKGVYGESFKDYETQLLNIKYTIDSLIIAKHIGCKKFILASTVNTLETVNTIVNKTTSTRYTNIYSSSKLTAEVMCKTFAYNLDIEFNTGIIAMVYGENNNSRMIPNVVMSNLINGKESNLVDPDLPFDMIYVDDVCKAFYAIGLKGINFKTYYIGSGKITTFKQVFDKVRDIINPNGIINYGYYKEKPSIVYDFIDVNELYNDTGFIPDSSFEESIKITTKWLIESGNNI